MPVRRARSPSARELMSQPRRGGSPDAGSAQNAEESEDRAGDHGGSRPGGADRLFFSAGGVGGHAAAGIEPATARFEYQDEAGCAAAESAPEGAGGERTDYRLL